MNSSRVGEIRGVGAAESEGNAEPLRGADHDVGTDVAGRDHQREGQQVGSDRDPRARGVRPRDHRGLVADTATRAGVLQQHAETIRDDMFAVRVGNDHGDPQRFGPGAYDLDGLRKTVGVDEEHVALIAVDPVEQRHRFGRGGRLVEHRRVCDLHAGEVGDHRLEVQERFEPTLRDFGLIRRVRRVPGRILEDVAQDHVGGDRVGVTEPDQRSEHLVSGAQHTESRQCLRLRKGGVEREGDAFANRGRDGRVDQRFEGRISEVREHRRLFGFADADVAVGERAANVVALGLVVRQQARAHRRTSLVRSGGSVRPRRRPNSPLSRNLRDSRGCGSFPAWSLSPSVRSAVSQDTSGLLSRGASLQRFGCLRVSGERLLLRRPG